MKIKALLTFRKHLARKKRDKDDEREKDSRSLFYSLFLSLSLSPIAPATAVAQGCIS